MRISDKLEKNLKEYPPGKIRISKRSKFYQYYLREKSTEKNGRYIPKNEKQLIRKYLQKSYDEKTFLLISKEISNIKTFLQQSLTYGDQIKELYSKQPKEIKERLVPIDMSEQDIVESWLESSFTPKDISDNIPVYITDNGERVRSKSELNIANTLHKMRVPYKYECPLVLNGGTIIYPDFTIFDVNSRTEKYWEHRGMMDDRDYCKHSVLRIKTYAKNDIFLGDRLIITEETATVPLGTDEIVGIIKHYFC